MAGGDLLQFTVYLVTETFSLVFAHDVEEKNKNYHLTFNIFNILFRVGMPQSMDTALLQLFHWKSFPHNFTWMKI